MQFAIVFFVGLTAASLTAVPAHAADTCHEFNHQFGRSQICVSSVLPPQGGNNYGPENLVGTKDDVAWCEGASGPGIGERITEHVTPRQTFRTLFITNGYAKSDEAFRRNGRIKRALIETDRGFKKTVTLADTREPQTVVIAKAKAAWVRLTIVEVYPGTSSDTCVTSFGMNLEEFGND